MRQRVTFIYQPGQAAFDPKKQLRVEKKAVQVLSLAASREDQLTLNLDEIPQEVWLALRQCRELHLRWVTERPYTAVVPFNARISSGLHVFLTPHGELEEVTLLCPLLLKVFGDIVDCHWPASSFTPMLKLSERFTPASAFNYHAPLASLRNIATYFGQKVCISGSACADWPATLASTDYMDVDWNLTSKLLVVKAYRAHSSNNESWDSLFRSADPSKLEVGVLHHDKPVPADLENLALGGLLTVVGEDSKPDSVLFTFPSRHHDLPISSSPSFSMSFVLPTGLHPTMRLSIAPVNPPAAPYCSLYAYLTLPSVLFPDKYQLSAPLFLASKNLKAVRAIWGETDLEAPNWAVSKWGSSMLVELAPPGMAKDTQWHADIPLHLRYLEPSAGGSATANIPWPALFWACRGVGERNLSSNPFDRTHLGYDGLFAPQTLFYHLQPNATAHAILLEKLEVPVLDVTQAGRVEGWTTTLIVTGLFWVLWKLLSVARLSKDMQESTYGRKKKIQ